MRASLGKEPSLFHRTCMLSIARKARFMLHSRQVVWLLSCP